MGREGEKGEGDPSGREGGGDDGHAPGGRPITKSRPSAQPRLEIEP